MRIIGGAFLLSMVIFSCTPPEQEVMVFSISYDFTTQDNGWMGDFADYPENDSLFYELFYYHDALPDNLNPTGTKKALHLSGNNHSDDLFMFIKKKVAGLRPNTTYEVLFNVKFASNAPTGSVGVGGSPGESVYLKSGATLEEPKKVVEEDGMFRMNIDKGNQSEGGEDMIVLGTIGVAETTTQFTTIARNNNSASGFIITTDERGEIWLVIGTDSGFEGTTSLYYTQVDVLFNEMQ